MKRSVIETVLGAVVLVLAGFFLVFSYKTADVRKVSGYEISAAFSGTGGLAMGDDVRISGVKVGSVNRLSLDQKNYLAVVSMSIDPSISLPDDTAAIISSDSLLGGRYLELQPGASDVPMKSGGRIQYTQAPQNLEELLGKFIFSMSSKDKGGSGQQAQGGNNSGGNEANPATPPAGLQQAPGGMPLLSATPPAEKAPPKGEETPAAEKKTEPVTPPADVQGIDTKAIDTKAGNETPGDAAKPTASPSPQPHESSAEPPTALQPGTTAVSPPSQPAFQSAVPDSAPDSASPASSAPDQAHP